MSEENQTQSSVGFSIDTFITYSPSDDNRDYQIKLYPIIHATKVQNASHKYTYSPSDDNRDYPLKLYPILHATEENASHKYTCMS